MTGSAVFAGAAAAAALIFTMAGPAAAQPEPLSGPGKVLIRLKGVVGQTYRTEIQSEMWTALAADGRTFTRGTSTAADIDSITDQVRPNGSTVEVSTTSRVRQVMLGTGVNYSLDTDDAAAMAGDDPRTHGPKLMLKAKMRIERDDRGRLLDFNMVTDDAAANTAVNLKASEMMASDAVILPEGPVGVGDSWEAQHREIPMAGVGRLNFVLVATVKQIIVRGGETRVLLNFSVRDPVFTAATAGQGTATLKSLEVTSADEFSLDQGRFLFMEETDAIRMVLTEPSSGTGEMDLLVHTTDRDVSGTLTAWFVQPSPSILTPERRASVGASEGGLSPDQATCFVVEGPTGPPDQRLVACAAVIAATHDENIIFKAHVGRAEAYFQLRRYADAIADLTAALAIKPDAEPTLRDRAELERVKGDLAAAVADSTAALAMNPKDAMAYVVRGMTRAQQRDVRNAMSDAEMAVKLDPKLANGYFLRGHLRIDAGDKAGGEADLAMYDRLHGSGG